jgi:hypothetical protein
MPNKQTFHFLAPISRRIPDPVFKQQHGIERHLFMVPVKSMPKGVPLDPNARRPNTNRRVYQRVENSLLDIDAEPGTFHLKNKGITIIAESVEQKGNDVYDVEIDGGQGIVDGGHTYTIIESNLENPKLPTNQFVSVEVRVGIPESWYPDIAQGLNTSVQVQEMSLDNLRGYFSWLIEELKSEPYFPSIAWSENDPGEYDARDIVGLLMAFNVALFPANGDDHPVASYEKKSSALKSFEQNAAVYEKMRPIAKDILRLHDIIAREGPELWNQLNPGAKAGHLSWVEYRDGKQKPHAFLFSGATGQRRLYDGALYPMLAAYRWYVERDKKSGLFRWRKSFDEVVSKFRDRDAKELLTATRHMSDQLGRNPNAIGKSRPHWGQMLNIVIKNDLMEQQVGKKAG